MTTEKKVLIMCPYPPDTVPSQRFRFEQYLALFDAAGIDAVVRPFYTHETYTILYQAGNTAIKIWAIIRGMAERFRLLRELPKYDYIFLHREAAPFGPPIVETIMFKRGARVIYDFDDAIFVPVKSLAASKLIDALKWNSKVAYITRRSHRVTVCNPFLRDWASRLNPNTIVLPTTVGPEYFARVKRYSPQQTPVIGWTGSRSTARYLELVRTSLRKLQDKFDFQFVVVCNYDPGFPEVKHYRFVPWRSSSEVDDLIQLDIGLMPVEDELFARGKVGLKAIQYSGLGIVPVVSDVGSGCEVVEHGKTGLVVPNTELAWYDALSHLLRNRRCWPTMGECARRYVWQRYSVESQAGTYLGLFA